MLIATCTCIYTKSWMRILNVSIQYVALYINTCLHTSTIITKSSSFTDRHTMVHHYVSPCMCSTGISLTLWTKKLFCYKQNKNEKNVRHWNEVKKRKKKENLDSLLVWDQHFPGLAAVSVWVCEKFTLFIVHAHCMAPRFQIPNSWDSFSLSA